MKRSGDDMFVGSSPLKRSFGSSRPESYAQGQVPVGEVGAYKGGSAAPNITTTDALTYLKEVKNMFEDNQLLYQQFLKAMKDFKEQTIDTRGVILRVKELFQGHDNLILGFNTFLPKGHKITLTEDETLPKKAVEFDEAVSFVIKLKESFQHDHVYKSFLRILNMYHLEHKSINEVYHEVSFLFKDHADLLKEFKRFLPEPSVTLETQNVSNFRNSLQRYDERSSAVRLIPVDTQCRRDKISTLHGDRDLSVNFPDEDDDKTMLKLHKEQTKRTEKENKERRTHDQIDREPEQKIDRDLNMQRLSNKKKTTKKLEVFGVNHVIASEDDKTNIKRMYTQDFTFFEKVKERLSNPDDYQAFLKCLSIYSTKIITRTDLQNIIADIIGECSDLMDEFNDLLENFEKNESLWSEGHVSRSVRAEEKDKEMKRERDRTKENDRYPEDYFEKSIQELDLSNCERCSPSYRLLPDDYPILLANQRSDMEAQVLNDHWVSVTSGSEDYSFKHMRRNQYEESLFRCEDDRFELDMLLESVASTSKRAEELLHKVIDNTLNQEINFLVETYFTALNLRCIERIYGDHGLDVIGILRTNPSFALPVILNRLQQKQEEWTKCREDFNKVWAEIYSKNHYKSLDHRSFYFKQHDSKNLSTKSLLSEIKEIREAKQGEDDALSAIAAGNRRPSIPDLEFENSNTEIHGDLYKLIHYSCEQVFNTKEQLQKITPVWSTFVEPMLGVPCRPYCAEDTENVVANTSNIASNGETYDSHDADASVLDSRLMKEDSLNDLNGAVRALEDDHLCNSAQNHGQNIVVVDNISGGKELLGSLERLIYSNDPPAIAPEYSEGKISMDVMTGCNEATPSISVNVAINDSHDHKVTGVETSPSGGGSSKSEKEEGELSPNGDFEENHFTVYGDTTILDMPKATSGDMNENAFNDEDRENASDVSGSDTGSDECSREEKGNGEDEVDHDDGKDESEGGAEVVVDGIGGDDDMPSKLSENSLQNVKPLVKHILSLEGDKEKKDSRIFYGNDNFYLFFRLYQILYDRILSAKMNCDSVEKNWRISTCTSSQDLYSRFMSALYNFLDGSSDNAKFEDDCRALVGNQAYVLFTLDKVISKLIKQLQIIISDEVEAKLLQLYEYEKSRRPEQFTDAVYHDNARVLLQDEKIYRFEFLSSPLRFSIKLMDGEGEKPTAAVSLEPNFEIYLNNDYLVSQSGKKTSSGVMLQRSPTCSTQKTTCSEQEKKET